MNNVQDTGNIGRSRREKGRKRAKRSDKTEKKGIKAKDATVLHYPVCYMSPTGQPIHVLYQGK
jgi:hypothetical protein